MLKNTIIFIFAITVVSCNAENPPKNWNYFNDIHNAEEMNIEYLMYEDSMDNINFDID